MAYAILKLIAKRLPIFGWDSYFGDLTLNTGNVGKGSGVTLDKNGDLLLDPVIYRDSLLKKIEDDIHLSNQLSVVEYKGTVVAVPGHNDIILNSGSVDDANNDSALTINEFGDVTLDRNGSSTKTLIRTEINGIVNYSIRYAI